MTDARLCGALGLAAGHRCRKPEGHDGPHDHDPLTCTNPPSTNPPYTAEATGTCPRGCTDTCLEDATGRVYSNCARRSERDELDGIIDLGMKLEVMVRRWESIVPVGTPEEIARHRTLVEDHAADVRRIINRAGRE